MEKSREITLGVRPSTAFDYYRDYSVERSAQDAESVISRNKSRGQSLVETALMLPLLLLILTGAVDLGRAYYAYVTITNAAREGARYGAAAPTDTSGIQNRAVNEAVNSNLNPALTTSNVTVACSAISPESYSSTYCSSVSNGEKIRVTISYNFQFVTTYILGLGTLTISNYTVMAVSQ